MTVRDKSESKKPLHKIFTAVPLLYDRVNHIITLGLDSLWRRKAARVCLSAKPVKMLDLCCGTGDLAINIAGLADYPLEITGIDYSLPMLEIAYRKSERPASRKKISFIHADVAGLPFPDGYFDSIGISFAFRNLTYKNPLTQRYLTEILRVLSPNGRFIIVESSQPRNRLIRKLFRLYLRRFVFPLGYLVSGNRPAYRYLTESAARFYTAEELSELLVKAGFSKVTFRRLLFGATAIHVATR